MRLRGSRARERRTVRERAKELNKTSNKLESEVLSEVFIRTKVVQDHERSMVEYLNPSKNPMTGEHSENKALKRDKVI